MVFLKPPCYETVFVCFQFSKNEVLLSPLERPATSDKPRSKKGRAKKNELSKNAGQKNDRLFYFIAVGFFKGPLKQKPKNMDQKKQSDRLSLSLFLRVNGLLMGYARRLWAWHSTLVPSAGCGVFLCELVSSDDPFVWCLCGPIFYFPTLFFLFPPKKISS
jgi:hypothetical protein